MVPNYFANCRHLALYRHRASGYSCRIDATSAHRKACQMTKEIHPVVSEIEAFCAARNMKETRFGRDAVNDPSLVDRLKNGREPRSALVKAIRHYIATGKALPKDGAES